MGDRSDWEVGLVRAWVAAGLMFLFFLVLGSKLWFIQVIHGPTYRDLVRDQSLRSVRIPAWRGRIYDRNGVVLAENRASHCIAVFPEELRKPGLSTRARVEAITRELELRLGVKPHVQSGQIERHLNGKERMMPLILWKDLDDRALARWAERVTPVPGIDIYTQPVRVYPRGELAAHTLGYVRDVVAYPDADEESTEDFDLYLPEMQGKLGLEKSLDDRLRGEAGGQLLMIDSLGYRHALLEQRPPRPGHDFQLTLDARVQALAEKVLGEEAGAAVVLDPNNGEVLALASSPRFDANQFMPRLPPALFQSLNDDPRLPWMNRPVQFTYFPGSTFKMIVAFASAVNDRVPLGRIYNCPGYIEIGGRRMHCAHRNGHGDLNLRQAIERSCNVYFFNLGLETGYEYIYHQALAVGLGQRTGIELGSGAEAPGFVGSDAYKRNRASEPDRWRDGDTCNVSIGQGMVNTTPLQMTLFAAAIANGGTLYRPRLVKAERRDEASPFVPTEPIVANTLSWPRDALDIVRAGMVDVVMSDHGTGRGARVAGLSYAAKTGTAQFRSGEHTEYQAWMIAYAPSVRPRYAVAIVLDRADAAALSIGPKMKELLEGLFRPPPAEDRT